MPLGAPHPIPVPPAGSVAPVPSRLGTAVSVTLSTAVLVGGLAWGVVAYEPFASPVWAAVLVISTIIANAVVVPTSDRDPLLALTAAPVIFLINASTESLGAVLTLWLTGCTIGTLLRRRNPPEGVQAAANMMLSGTVMALTWFLLGSGGAVLPLRTAATVAVFLATRILLSVLRMLLVQRLNPLDSLRAVTWPRAVTMWVAVSLATLAGHGLAALVEGASTVTIVQARNLSALMLGLVALTLGAYFEYVRVETRLHALVRAAKALPWPAGTPVAKQAADFLREALPHRVITLSTDDEGPRPPISAALPGGFLQARRTLIQPPLRSDDRELVEAFANIAQTTSDAGAERDTLHHAATRDPLTGLLNYRGFTEALTGLEYLESGGLAIMYLDLDGFKAINDSHGHSVGNLVLQTVAERLLLVLAPDDIVSRVGGDEFVVLLVGLHDAESAQRTAENICAVISTPVLAEETVVLVSASFGLAYTESKTADLAELMDFADARMYASRGNLLPTAAASAGDRGHFAVGDIDELINAITRAIISGSLELAYQPIIDADLEQVVALEALVRVNDPVLGPIPADIVVHEARRLGLVTDLSTAVLSRALADIQLFRTLALDPLDLHFNVDVEQITDAAFLGALRRFMESTSSAVTLELSETSLHRAQASTFAELESLNHSQRLQIALDDFGVAQSTLQSVVDYPLSVLKIDKSMVNDLTDDKSRHVLRALSTLCHGLGIRMIVEGVADEDQMHALAALGIRYVQGYYFGAPMGAGELFERFSSYGTTCPQCTRRRAAS